MALSMMPDYDVEAAFDGYVGESTKKVAAALYEYYQQAIIYNDK